MSKTFATQRRFLNDIAVAAVDGSDVREGQQGIARCSSTSSATVATKTTDDGDEVSKGRQNFRRLLIKSKPLKGCSGSAIVEMGSTRVCCAVNGPREQSGGAADSALEGTLNVYLRGNIDPALRYSLEHALQAVVCLKKLARTEVDVELNVLSDDGGALAACLLAAGVALVSANIEMFDIVLACHFLVLPPKSPSNASTSSAAATIDPSSKPILIVDPDQAAIQTSIQSAATLTMAIIPSIGQVICLEFGGVPLPSTVVRHAIPFAFERCLKLYPYVRQTLLASINNVNTTLANSMASENATTALA